MFVRLTTLVAPDQLQWLRLEAARVDRPLAWVLRRALERDKRATERETERHSEAA